MRSKITHIAVGADGRGSTFEQIVLACKKKKIPANVVLLFSSNPQARAIKLAKKFNIPAKIIKHPSELDKILDPNKIDLICLAGFLKLVPATVCKKFKNRILNSHPGPIPEFGGKGMYGERVHQVRLEFVKRTNRNFKTAATIHFVDEIYDHGERVKEKWIKIKANDTPESLSQRLLPFEHKIYLEAIKNFCQGNLKPLPPRKKPLVKNKERKILQTIKKEILQKKPK